MTEASRPKSHFIAASFVAIALTASPVRAEDESAADTAAARTLAVEGLKLADAGQCGEAIDKLARAEKLHHAPIVLGRLGECQIAEGKIVDGTEALRRLLREPLPPNPSPALLRAREHAQAALDGAKPKIAKLNISVKGPGEGISVTVDGQAVPGLLLDHDRPTDPGQHVVEATAPGYLKATQQVSVGPGEMQAVALELEPDPNAPKTSGPTAEATAPGARPPGSQPTQPSLGAAPATRRAAPNRTAAYVTWGAGAAALAAGSILGLVALRDKNDLDDRCTNNVCPPDARSQLDLAKTAGTVSTVLFGVAGAGLVLGTVFYFTAGPSSTAETPQASFRTRAWVGVGSVGLDGKF
jgi:hypothetical protein